MGRLKNKQEYIEQIEFQNKQEIDEKHNKKTNRAFMEVEKELIRCLKIGQKLTQIGFEELDVDIIHHHNDRQFDTNLVDLIISNLKESGFEASKDAVQIHIRL